MAGSASGEEPEGRAFPTVRTGGWQVEGGGEGGDRGRGGGGECREGYPGTCAGQPLPQEDACVEVQNRRQGPRPALPEASGVWNAREEGICVEAVAGEGQQEEKGSCTTLDSPSIPGVRESDGGPRSGPLHGINEQGGGKDSSCLEEEAERAEGRFCTTRGKDLGASRVKAAQGFPGGICQENGVSEQAPPP